MDIILAKFVTHRAVADTRRLDFIGDLPAELGALIVSQLDAQSLLNAACASKKWLSVCKSSTRLRQRALRHFRRLNALKAFPPANYVNSRLDIASITLIMLIIIQWIRRLIFRPDNKY